MKRWTTVLILIVFIPLGAQQVIENPKTPLSANAGRVIELVEEMRITDDVDNFVFSYPYGLKVAKDGSIFVYDSWILHKFDTTGKLVLKVFKQGEGPGEATRRTYFQLTDQEIIISAYSPPKVMKFDLDGKFIEEMRWELGRDVKPIQISSAKIYGTSQEILRYIPVSKDYIDYPAHLYEISFDFESVRKIQSFPIKHFALSPSANWARARITSAIYKNEFMFISHTRGYRITKFDLENHEIKRIFLREYAPVEAPPPSRKIPEGVFAPPPYKYLHDIRALLIHDKLLWAITSTEDEKGRILVDVYDFDGKYLDNFYFEFPNHIKPNISEYRGVALWGDFLVTIDESQDGFYSIAKYRILDII